MAERLLADNRHCGARTRAGGDFRYRTADSIKQGYRRSLARLGSGGCRRFCLPTILRGNSRKRGDARGQSKRTPPNLCFARRLGDLGRGADRRLCAQPLVVGLRRDRHQTASCALASGRGRLIQHRDGSRLQHVRSVAIMYFLYNEPRPQVVHSVRMPTHISVLKCPRSS